MATIMYEPIKNMAMGTVTLEVTNGIQHGIEVIEQDTGWISKLAAEIGKQVEIAIGNAIQEHIVIPIKVFIFNSWQVILVVSKWGCVAGFIVGGFMYMTGDETKGKKIALGSLIIQLIIQLINYVFLG